MSPILKEIIGIVATLLILSSMLFKTTSIKGSLFMRAFNLIGSVVFVFYGIILPSISTAILNGALILINSYHLFTLLKQSKGKNMQEKETN